MYIEKTTGFNHNGPAWICEMEFSRTGNTAYFDNKSLKKEAGIVGNFYDIETGEEYWVSGPKKNGEDRHKFGTGIILVEEKILEEYKSFLGINDLDIKKYQNVILKDTHKSKFNEIENETKVHEKFNSDLQYKNLIELDHEELLWLANYYEEEEINSSYNKNRRHVRKLKIAVLEQISSRETAK